MISERVKGYLFFGRGEKRNGVKLNKTVSFDPFLDIEIKKKPLKNRSNDSQCCSWDGSHHLVKY
jgi:hypothetical protein